MIRPHPTLTPLARPIVSPIESPQRSPSQPMPPPGILKKAPPVTAVAGSGGPHEAQQPASTPAAQEPQQPTVTFAQPRTIKARLAGLWRKVVAYHKSVHKEAKDDRLRRHDRLIRMAQTTDPTFVPTKPRAQWTKRPPFNRYGS